MADFKLSANIEVRKQAPLDDRLAKMTKADLIKPESWASDNGTYYVYPYMVVGTANGLFMLMDVNKLLDADYSGWKKIGEGGSNGISEEEIQELIDAAILEVEGKIPTDYIKEIPSEYVTELELEERLADFSGGDATGGITQGQAQAMVNVEKLRAEQAETALQAAINTEVERAEDAEKVLSDAIAEVEGKIPTKTSQLLNDSNFLTGHQSLEHLATKDELSEYAKKTDIPTDYIKEIPSEYVTETELEERLAEFTPGTGGGTTGGVTEDRVQELIDASVPTNVSELTNDSGYITLADVDLSSYAKKTDIPTDYLTEIPSEYITDLELEERLANFGGEGGGSLTEGISLALAQALVNVEKIRAEKIEASLLAQIDTEVTRAKAVEQQLTERITQETANSNAAYDQINTRIDNEISRATEAEQTIEGKIPTKVSQLLNDSNFLTSHQDISHLATKTELSGKQDVIPDLQEIREGSQRHIPSKVSELENDSGYFTQNDCDARYLLKQVFSNIFTAYDADGNIVDITNVGSVIDNVGINYNLWSTGYISSLGKQADDSFGGSAMALYQLVDVEEYGGKVMGALNGSVLMYDGTHWNAKTNIIADLAAAKSDSNQALIQSGEAKVIADAAKTQSDVAIQSIKSLQGLSDADLAMVEIANQIVLIQLNAAAIETLKQQHVAMSLAEFEQIELEGLLKEGVFYYIYEE